MNIFIFKKIAGGIIYESHLSALEKLNAFRDILKLDTTDQIIKYVSEKVDINLLRSKTARADKIARRVIGSSIAVVGGHKLLKNMLNPCSRICDSKNGNEEIKCLQRCGRTNDLIKMIKKLQKVNCSLTTSPETCTRIKEEKIAKLRQELDEI